MPSGAEDAGADVSIDDGKAIVRVNDPRMYRLVSNRAIDTHDLTLVTVSGSLALYAFTFLGCVVPEG